MAIQSIGTEFAGQVGINPRKVSIACNNTYAEVTALNFLQSAIKNGYVFYPTDFLAIAFTDGFGWFNPSITSDGITLVPTPSPGGATGSVTDGHFAVFDGTNGLVKDAGFSPSNPLKSRVSMVGNPTVVNNLAKFEDTVGTVLDAGIAASAVATYTGATVSGNVTRFNNTTGQTIDSGVALTSLQLKSNILAGTGSYGGGSASFTSVLTGLTASSIIQVQFITQANAVEIRTVEATNNTINIVATGNPGACTFSYIAFLVGQ